MSIKKNTLWSLTGIGLPLILGTITIPYLINQIGTEKFGILTLIWALIGYFSLFDLGLGRALTQQVATSRSQNDLDSLPHLIKTGLFLTTVAGLIGGSAIALFSNEITNNWLNVSLPLQKSTYSALLITAIGIPLTTITSGLRGVLEGFEDFRTTNLLRIALGSANFGLPALSVMLIDNALPTMVGSLLLARIIITILHAKYMIKKINIFLCSTSMSKKTINQLFSFGAWMTISNIISPLLVTADRFIISALLGASVVAYYTAPFEMLYRLLIIPGALTSALFPRISLAFKTNFDYAKFLYRKSLKITSVILLPLCIIIAFNSELIISYWLGDEFAKESWVIASIMTIGIYLNGIAQIPFAAIQAEGNARITAKIHFLEFLFYIPFLYFSIIYFGITGAAIAWVIRVGIDSLALLIYANHRNL